VREVRPFLADLPVYSSAWPFVRELVPSIDIYSMMPYGDPRSLLERAPIKEARALGKAVGLTLDGTPNLVMDRQAINHRLPAWHGWYAGVPFIEYWSNIAWVFRPWDPKPIWFSPKWIVPGDGNLTYPPKTDDEVVTSLRAENVREGMEDYEYLWMLRHGAYVIRMAGDAGKEADLLRRIDLALWDAYEWVAKGTYRSRASDYIMTTQNLFEDRMPWLAFRLDALRENMGEILEELHRKGYLVPEKIDTGHAPPKEWFRYNGSRSWTK
jgi:hypothetical protein